MGKGFLRFCFPDSKESVSICGDPWQTKIRRASKSGTVGLKMRQPGPRMKPPHCNL